MKKNVRIRKWIGFAVLLAVLWSVALLGSCQFALVSGGANATDEKTENATEAETVVEPSRPSGTYRHEESKTQNGKIISRVVSDLILEGDTLVFNESETQDDIKLESKVTYCAEIGDNTVELYTKKDKSEDSRISTLYYTLEKNTLTLYYTEAGYNNKIGGVEYIKTNAGETGADALIVPTVDEPGRLSGTYSREASETYNDTISAYVQSLTFAGDTLIIEEEERRDDALTTRKTSYYAEIDDNTVKLFTKQDKSEGSRVTTMYYTLEDDTLTLYFTEAGYNAGQGGTEYEYKE